MQVVQSGYTFRTYDDSVKTYAGLPAGCYDVNFDKQTGFFLSKHDDIEINEKVYGVHLEKTQKVLNLDNIIEMFDHRPYQRHGTYFYNCFLNTPCRTNQSICP